MKLNSLSILTAATLMLGVANANAGIAFDLYAGATAGFGGHKFTVDDYSKRESAKSYGMVAGIDIPFIRLEGEYNYMTGEKVDVQILALNAYVKMPGLIIVTPYVGGGIGGVLKVDTVKSLIPADYELSGKAIYQGMLGATFDIPTLPIKVDVEGRLVYAPKLIDIAAPVNETAKTIHYDARVKLRYIF